MMIEGSGAGSIPLTSGSGFGSATLVISCLHDTKVKALQLFNACHEDKHNRNCKRYRTASNSFKVPLSFMDVVQRGGEEGHEDARLND